MAEIGRFAPSTTGPAHPGTLLAALLCWLDARSSGGRVLLRLEDLDPERCQPRWSQAMRDDLAWLGLDWDGVGEQSRWRDRHEAALDDLARAGLLYPCRCSRKAIRAHGQLTPDGGLRYPGSCRSRGLPTAGWRACEDALRLRLPEGRVEPRDEGGLDLSADPARELGDPVVRRRDGAIAYQLASVVDDHASGVTRVIRGRDLATSSALQTALHDLLGHRRPLYRHHLLLLEEHGTKLAKFHGAVGTPELRAAGDARSLCGLLAQAAGLLSEPAPVAPRELVDDFAWSRVASRDRVLRWTGARLELLP